MTPMMIYDDLWWFMMSCDELWWVMMSYDEFPMKKRDLPSGKDTKRSGKRMVSPGKPPTHDVVFHIYFSLQDGIYVVNPMP